MAYRIGKCLLPYWLQQFGITQSELADRLGVSRQQVHKWASGKQKMSMEAAKNVSTILELDHADNLYEWVQVRNWRKKV